MEFALLLPVAVLMVLALGQVGVVVRSRLMLTQAAREGARVAAVGGSDAEVRAVVERASGLAPSRLEVEVRRGGGVATIVLTYVDPTDVALVGGLIDDAVITAAATMRLEPA